MIVASQWQWSRYKEKLELVETYKNHNSAAAYSIEPSISLENIYQKHVLKGVFDYQHQFALKNRKSGYGVGFHLFTPLITNQDRAVLVSRGFIPFEDRDSTSWDKYSFNPGTEVEIFGVLQPTVEKKTFLSPSNPEIEADKWETLFLFPDLEYISRQFPYEIYTNGYFQRLGTPKLGTFPEEAVSIRVPPSTHYWYSWEWLLLAFLTFSGSLLVQLMGKKIEARREARANRFKENIPAQ